MKIASVFLLLCLTAHADSAFEQPSFDAAFGYEWQQIEFTSHQDRARSGFRLSIKVEDLKLEKSFNNGSRGRIVFVPLRVVFAQEKHGAGFGRVADYEAQPSHVRRITGALVQTGYVSKKERLFARAKFVSFDYDRDRGLWDWRVLDVAVGVRLARTMGTYVVSLETNIGSGIGGLELKSLDKIEEALQVEPVRAQTLTLSPYASFIAAVRTPRLKVEWIAEALKRIELSSSDENARYLGRELSVESHVLESALDVQYSLGRSGGTKSKVSFYGNVAYQYDSLTLGHVVFGARDSFQSLGALTGIRGRF